MAVAKKKEVVTLTTKNSVTLNTQVSSRSIKQLIKDVRRIDSVLEKGKPIYLVLDTPGGSIIAGNKFIRFARSLDREIKTIVIFAASMGFQIAQALGERLATFDGVYMAHAASAGCRGNVHEVKSCLQILEGLDTILKEEAAKRMKMSIKEYRDLIKYDRFFIGKERFKYNVMDRVIRLKCSKELMDKITVVKEQVFIFVRKVKKSSCPLI